MLSFKLVRIAQTVFSLYIAFLCMFIHCFKTLHQFSISQHSIKKWQVGQDFSTALEMNARIKMISYLSGSWTPMTMVNLWKNSESLSKSLSGPCRCDRNYKRLQSGKSHKFTNHMFHSSESELGLLSSLWNLSWCNGGERSSFQHHKHCGCFKFLLKHY